MNQDQSAERLADIVTRQPVLFATATAATLMAGDVAVQHQRQCVAENGYGYLPVCKATMQNNHVVQANRQVLVAFEEAGVIGWDFTHQTYGIVLESARISFNKVDVHGRPAQNRTHRSRERSSQDAAAQIGLFCKQTLKRPLPSPSGGTRRLDLLLGYTTGPDGRIDTVSLIANGAFPVSFGLNHFVRSHSLAMMGPARRELEELARRASRSA